MVKHFITVALLMAVVTVTACSPPPMVIPSDEAIVEMIKKAPADKEVSISGPNALDPPVRIVSFDNVEIYSVQELSEFVSSDTEMVPNLLEQLMFYSFAENKKMDLFIVNCMVTGTVKSEIVNSGLTMKFPIPAERSLEYPTSLWFGFSKLKESKGWGITLLGYEE